MDDQDKAWTAIDRFFSFRQSNSMDFQTYHWEWQHLYDEAETQGGLQLSEPAKCWLFWSRTSFSDKTIAELRLHVKGDLNRWREMIHLQLKICRNEYASQEQARDYKHTYNTENEPDTVEDDTWPDDYDYSEYDDYYDDDWEEYDYDDYYDDDWYDDQATNTEDDYNDYEYDETYHDDYYGKGKNKGKKPYGPNSGKGKGYGGKRPEGQQCTHCGSRWHDSNNCPLNQNDKNKDSDHQAHQTSDSRIRLPRRRLGRILRQKPKAWKRQTPPL